MNQQQRLGIRPVAFFVDEVNSESVDARLEMREAIDFALMRAPVVFRSPVLDQFLEVGEIGSVLPRRYREPRRESACCLSRARKSASTSSGTSTRNGSIFPPPMRTSAAYSCRDRHARRSRRPASCEPMREQHAVTRSYFFASASLASSLAVLPSRPAPNLSRSAFMIGPICDAPAAIAAAISARTSSARGRGRQIRFEDLCLGLVLIDQVLARRLAREFERSLRAWPARA